jgi:hypothetical protein
MTTINTLRQRAQMYKKTLIPYFDVPREMFYMPMLHSRVIMIYVYVYTLSPHF